MIFLSSSLVDIPRGNIPIYILVYVVYTKKFYKLNYSYI